MLQISLAEFCNTRTVVQSPRGRIAFRCRLPLGCGSLARCSCVQAPGARTHTNTHSLTHAQTLERLIKARGWNGGFGGLEAKNVPESGAVGSAEALHGGQRGDDGVWHDGAAAVDLGDLEVLRVQGLDVRA